MLINSTLRSSLADLFNVTDVDGTPPDSTYRATLSVQQNNALTSLGLTRLVRLGGSTVYVRDNIGLCLQTTIDWAGLMWATSKPKLFFNFTLPYIESVSLFIQQGTFIVLSTWTTYQQNPNCGADVAERGGM